MKNLILIEYFTSQSTFDLNKDKEIFREALNMTNSIIKNFIQIDQIKNLIVIRNENLKIIKSKKIQYFFTNKNLSYIDILDDFKINDEVILIAPEIQKISLKIYSNLRKKFVVLGSDLKCMQTFSSKIKTLQTLKELKLPVVEFNQTLSSSEGLFIIKPDYGAGSNDIILTNKVNVSKIKRSSILQKFYKGKKGSFLMLCKNGTSKVISCNEQIIKINKKKIKQIGCIMGGLEDHRKEIEILAREITNKFKGLFGLIGVDIVREKKKWLILEINSRFTSSYCGLEHSYSSKTIKEITNFYIKKKIGNATPKNLNRLEYIF